MVNDKIILRELVKTYGELASKSGFEKKYEIHKAINDLKPIRPTVLIDELPWNQMNFDGSLTLLCQDDFLKKIEFQLRQNIYKLKYFPCDIMFENCLNIPKSINLSGFGMNIEETTKKFDSTSNITSHKYISQFNCVEDIEKIKMPTITYDEIETKKRCDLVSDCVGDLIDIRLNGMSTSYQFSYKVWDIIASYMTVDDLLINLMDEPEFMHELIQKLSDVFTSTVDQLEVQGLLDENDLYCHCSATPCSDIEKAKDPTRVTPKNMWGRGLAQILATVSPAMHDEFEVQYANKALERYGLVYYGCCEPLDRKIDILRQIKNLRKISITPWADFNIASEAIGSDYAISAKANPSALCVKNINEKAIEKELSDILKACQKNNSPVEIILKDISTVSNNPKSLFKWAEIAMSLVK
ncbi:MAG: hypothetical protein R3Y35_09645 [Clostridia bacterium]